MGEGNRAALLRSPCRGQHRFQAGHDGRRRLVHALDDQLDVLPGRWGYLGLKLAAWIALLTLLPAEFVGAKSGIGYVIWQSWQSFRAESMYVGIALAGGLGVLAWLVLDLAERLVGAVIARRAGVT